MKNFKLKITLLAICFIILSPQEASAAFILQAPKYIGLNSGLVGHWSFDGPDVVNVTAYDKSGQANHGTLTNGPTKAQGKLGQALSFDGSNDYVNMGSNTLAPTIVSISAWVKTSSTGSGGTANTVVDKNRGVADGSAYLLSVGGRVGAVAGKAEYAKYDGSWSYATSNTSVNDSSWHHIVATDDLSNMRIYIDGVLDKTTAATDALNYNVSGPFSIGRYESNTDALFNGLIDDVRVYNRALTADEIKRLYKIGGTLKIGETISNDSLKTGLVGHWSFDGPDVVNVTAYDKSGQANHGTLTNGPTKAQGKLGQALSFDGSNDGVNVNGLVNDIATGPASISFWFKLNVNHAVGLSDKEIFGFYDASSNNDFEIWLDDLNGRLEFTSLDSLGASHDASSDATSWTKGIWYHGTAIFDTTYGMSLYVNGVKQSDTSPSTSRGSTLTTTAAIGISPDNTCCFFNGLIDDVRIYNRALSADEIKRLYKIGGTLKIGETISNDSLKTGLVGHWSFDGPDVVNVTAYDKSGQANHGTLTNGPTKAQGKLGQALSFDGSNDMVDAGKNTSLNNLSALTISTWVYARSAGEGGIGSLITKGGANSSGWEFFMFGSSLPIMFRVNHDTTSLKHTTSNNAIGLNKWHHVVVAWDGSSTAANVHIYIDGIETTYQTTVNGVGSRVSDATDNLIIGNKDLLDNTWDGFIDDVRVYNRALTADEIKRLYNLGK